MCADLRQLLIEDAQVKNGAGRAVWRLNFEIEFKFGTTEYEARVKWPEKVCHNNHHIHVRTFI